MSPPDLASAAGPDDGAALDPLAILAALGVQAPRAVLHVPGGSDTAVWKIGTSQGWRALRVFRPDEDERCRRECAALRLAQENGLPVPAVRRQGFWRRRPVMLLDWLPGNSLSQATLRHPARAWRWGVEFGQTQASMHAITASAPELAVGGWLADAEAAVNSGLRAQLDHVEGPAALLHLDYHASNTLVAGQRVSGVIDWANSGRGDPRYDLARTELIFRMNVQLNESLGLRSRICQRALHRGWRLASGFAAGAPSTMRIFLTWAGVATLRDLAPKLGQPGCTWRRHHLDRLSAWVERWQDDILAC
ncbi:MAG TPA: phosphotransferase [Herpetosiphonaceae bacterium]|nr:phosphotransferase [Herpetosiphonaceae bacterium]